MAINKYPMTNFNEYNLDWIVRKIREFEKNLTEYEALHSITFGGDWDISKSYTQWTIVSDPITHDGYLSLQPVPANVPITNTAYWLKIADYTTGLAAVNARIDDVEADIDDLENVINDMKTRRVIIFGDSYLENRAILNDQPVAYWLEQYLSDTNIEFEVNAQGREGFAVSGTDSFLYDVQNYTSAFDADQVTDVLFCGGFNDREYNISQIESGMNLTFAEVRSKYPNAKISVGHFGWDGHWYSDNRSALVRISIPAYKNCGKFGAAYMINSEFTMHWYELFTSDDWIHPTIAGVQEISKQIALYLLGGSCDVHYEVVECPFNSTGAPEGWWTDSTYAVASKLDNDLVTIYMPDGNITYTSRSAFDCLHNEYTELIKMTALEDGYRLHFMGNFSTDYVMQKIEVVGNFQVGATAFKDFTNCSFIIHEGRLKVRPYKLNSDGDAFDEVTGVLGLNFVGSAITIPTLAC